MSAVRKNLVWLLLSQLATWAVTLVAIVIVPRFLGDDDFGTLSFAAAFVGFFTLVAGLGTSTLMTREVARDHSILGPYVYNTLVMKLVLGAVLSVLCVSLARILGTTGGTLVLIAVGCVGMLFTILGEVLHSALAGLERMSRPAFWFVVQVYVTTAVGLLALALGGGVVIYGSIFALGVIIPTTAMALMLRTEIRGHRHLDPTIWKWLVRAGIPLTALSASNLIYGTVDIPILQYISGSQTVGWYSLAQKWVGIPVFISTAVMAAFYPSFSALAAKALHVQFGEQVNKAVLLVMVAALPAAVGIGVIAEDLLTFLYNDEFANSVSVMQILSVQIPLAAMDTILAMALIAAHRQRRYIMVAAAAAVLNPIATIVAINWSERMYSNGAIGAAVATVGTELLIMGGALVLRSPGVLDRTTVLKMGRMLAAALAMGAAVVFAGGLPLAVRVAIGIVAYAAASIAFGTVSVGELRSVLRQGLSTVGTGRPAMIDDATMVDDPTTIDERKHDGGDDPAGGSGEAPHVGGDLYAQPGGQDRDGGQQHPGE